MIENFTLRSEQTLSAWSAIPCFGTLFGVTKIGLGLIQTIAAVALLIIFAIPRLTGNAKESFNRAWRHLFHGAANITAGIIESIPFVSSYLFFERVKCRGSTGNGFSPSNLGSFIGYKKIAYIEMPRNDEYFMPDEGKWLTI